MMIEEDEGTFGEGVQKVLGQVTTCFVVQPCPQNSPLPRGFNDWGEVFRNRGWRPTELRPTELNTHGLDAKGPDRCHSVVHTGWILHVPKGQEETLVSLTTRLDFDACHESPVYHAPPTEARTTASPTGAALRNLVVVVLSMGRRTRRAA